MSKSSNGTKRAGKLLAAVTILILAAVLVGYWYINGQTRTIEKFCAAAASGNYDELDKLSSTAMGSALSENQPENYNYFKSLPEFSELDSANIIGSTADVTAHKLAGKLTSWECVSDVDFYCNGKSVSYTDVLFELTFSGGKWKIVSVNSLFS